MVGGRHESLAFHFSQRCRSHQPDRDFCARRVYRVGVALMNTAMAGAVSSMGVQPIAAGTRRQAKRRAVAPIPFHPGASLPSSCPAAGDGGPCGGMGKGAALTGSGAEPLSRSAQQSAGCKPELGCPREGSLVELCSMKTAYPLASPAGPEPGAVGTRPAFPPLPAGEDYDF